LGGDFKRLDTRTAKETHGASLSKLKPTKTEALLKFVVVDKGEGEPIPGVVVSLTGPDGNKYYTEATDAVGYAEVLVPAGKQYEVVYVSLKGKDIGAALNVENKERYTLKLTLRYQGYVGVVKGQPAARLVLQGVEFDTGKATIRPSSFARLDGIVEYLAHKQDARIEISGHTDNVGVPANNKTLSTKRAEACRDYLVGQGIDAARVQAVGYGDERPIASNDTAEGRQTNRRIEAEEL
jgi:outer membrane protein OmpA-like peptidoglycan-associated protein